MAKSGLDEKKLKASLERTKKGLADLIRKYGSKENMEKLGEEAARLIVVRTRQGKTAEGGPFPPFDRGNDEGLYVKYRNRYKKLLHGSASVKKPTNTFTGQLLDSLGVRKAQRGKVFIGPTTERRTDIFGGASDITNSELIEELEKMGREFLKLSDKNLKFLLRFFRILIKDENRKSRFKPKSNRK